MGIGRSIMYQSAAATHEQASRAAWHLEEDRQLFLRVEAGGGGLWRVWHADGPAVVLGHNLRIDEHVHEDACHADSVPVLRRFSGGGAVVLGPGSFNYALCVPLVSRPELTDVSFSFEAILGHLVDSLGVPGLAVEGSDLALEGRKVSGNAQRRGRRALLHHGTLLYAFDPALASRYLKVPARQPAYRAGRSHEEFLGNLPLPADTLRERVETALSAFCAA